MRILYVEDNMVNVSLVRRIARNDELINYIDGEEALKNFERDNPDLILLDIQLAGKMTGLDVVRELRKQGCRLPIIAVTAYAMVGDRERCIEAGCDDYIAKPLPIPTLLELFEKRRQEVSKNVQPAPQPTPTTRETVEAPRVEVNEPIKVAEPVEETAIAEESSASQSQSQSIIETQDIEISITPPASSPNTADTSSSSPTPHQATDDDTAKDHIADNLPSIKPNDAIEK